MTAACRHRRMLRSVELRTTTSPGETRMISGDGRQSSMMALNNLISSRTIVSLGIRRVVSECEGQLAMAMSSQPAIDKFSGTET